MTEDLLRALLQLGGMLLTVVTLAFGIMQYRTAQLWRTKELIAKETKEFFADDHVMAALRLMDWRAFKVDLPRPDLPHDQRRVAVTGTVLVAALRTSTSVHRPAMTAPAGMEVDEKSMPAPAAARTEDRFSPVEVYIRDVFDRYLDGLERFDHYVESGLVRASDVEPYMRYWFEIMSGRRPQMEPDAQSALASYIRTYGYDGTVRLMKRCGYEL